MFLRGKQGIYNPIDMLCLLLKTCSRQSTHPKIEKIELAWQNKRDEAGLPAFASAAFHMSSPLQIVNILSSTEFRKVQSCKGSLHATSEYTHALHATGWEIVEMRLFLLWSGWSSRRLCVIREFKIWRRQRQRQCHKSMIPLVEWRKMIVLHVRHAFWCNVLT